MNCVDRANRERPVGSKLSQGDRPVKELTIQNGKPSIYL